MPLALSLPALLALLSQAEAAPADAPPPSPPPAPSPSPSAEDPLPSTGGPTSVGLGIGLGQRLPPASDDVSPRLGLSFAVLIAHAYARPAERVHLAVEANFSYDRYSRSVTGSTPNTSSTTPETTFEDIRTISAFDFSALQTVALSFTPMQTRAWVGAGGGIGMGYFFTREKELRPGESKALSPLIRGAAGVEVNVGRDSDLGLRLDYSHPISPPGFTTETGERLRVFGDRLAIHVALLYRF